MKTFAALLACAALGACAGTGGSGNAPGGITGAPLHLGALADPDAKGTTAAKVLALETACACHLDYVKSYPGFPPATGYDKGTLDFFAWTSGTNKSVPLIVISSRIGAHGCALYADDIAGKYDANIDAVAKQIPAGAFVDLFAEPSNNGPEMCADPGADPALAQRAWQYVATRLRNDGVHATFIQSLGAPLWEGGTWQQWYAGDTYVDEVSEHIYDTTGPENFHAAICAQHLAGKPFAVTETGTGPDWQAQWLSTVKSACPSLEQLDYFDRPAALEYQLTPAGAAAFGALGQ